MPVDSAQWASKLHLSNFVNSYYQYRDITELPSCKKILIVGPGQGLDTQILKWCGYHVTTFDIDDYFSPDHIGSVHDLSRFFDFEFDVITASHVLEHLPVQYLDSALNEMARVARYSLVYLPYHGRHISLRFCPGFGNIDLSFILDLFNYFEKPSGDKPRYMQNMHYWEVGLRGWRPSDLKRKFSNSFQVLKSYRNMDWLPSYNFILKSRT